MKWWDQMPWIFVFWMLSFKPTFSLSSFPFIKRLFSSSSLSAIRVVSSAYLRLLIFLPAVLIPACISSSPAFLMMYSAYKLNKQTSAELWKTRSIVLEKGHLWVSFTLSSYGTKLNRLIMRVCLKSHPAWLPPCPSLGFLILLLVSTWHTFFKNHLHKHSYFRGYFWRIQLPWWLRG